MNKRATIFHLKTFPKPNRMMNFLNQDFIWSLKLLYLYKYKQRTVVRPKTIDLLRLCVSFLELINFVIKKCILILITLSLVRFCCKVLSLVSSEELWEIRTFCWQMISCNTDCNVLFRSSPIRYNYWAASTSLYMQYRLIIPVLRTATA